MTTIETTTRSSDESSLDVQVTLAAGYSIVISTDTECKWSLYPIDQVVAAENILADGARSMRALSSAITTTVDSVATLSCGVVQPDSLEVTWTVPSMGVPAGIDVELLDLLQRIFLQWTLKQSRTGLTTTPCRVMFVQTKEDPMIIDLSSHSGLEKLYDGLVDTSSNSIEWVEMVSGNGVILGKVPRRLVHKFNLLHRGIGLFVTKDRPINLSSNGDFPSLYVHRRSATKRIFPSLYDMFVGGVSLADEQPEVTARREVAEELGLSRALVDDQALIGPILNCTVCTAYNRCLVTLFSYTMKSQEETVTWQEEEVDWGSFVPYPVIVAAADRSIQRFASKESWPGTYPPFQSSYRGVLDGGLQYDDDAWTEWDFVPDGLLVWEAWMQFLEGPKSP